MKRIITIAIIATTLLYGHSVLAYPIFNDLIITYPNGTTDNLDVTAPVSADRMYLAYDDGMGYNMAPCSNIGTAGYNTAPFDLNLYPYRAYSPFVISFYNASNLNNCLGSAVLIWNGVAWEQDDGSTNTRIISVSTPLDESNQSTSVTFAGTYYANSTDFASSTYDVPPYINLSISNQSNNSTTSINNSYFIKYG